MAATIRPCPFNLGGGPDYSYSYGGPEGICEQNEETIPVTACAIRENNYMTYQGRSIRLDNRWRTVPLYHDITGLGMFPDYRNTFLVKAVQEGGNIRVNWMLMRPERLPLLPAPAMPIAPAVVAPVAPLAADHGRSICGKVAAVAALAISVATAAYLATLGL